MIQIPEWTLLAGLGILFLLSIAYLFHFVVSKKLFPTTKYLNEEISPNHGATIYEMKGSGIVKTIKLEINENCIIDIIIDQNNHTLLQIRTELEEKNFEKLAKKSLTVEENINHKFKRNFAIHIQNQADKTMQYSGFASYEIKKNLRNSVEAVLSELFK
jgi:hypothetical protein